MVLVDGARHQLDLIRAEAERRGVRVHILVDLIHVLEYLWRAAWCFHAEGDPHAEAWVATHAISILSGHAAQTIATNGDLDRYWRFHLARDNHRVHQAPDQDTYDLAA